MNVQTCEVGATLVPLYVRFLHMVTDLWKICSFCWDNFL